MFLHRRTSLGTEHQSRVNVQCEVSPSTVQQASIVAEAQDWAEAAQHGAQMSNKNAAGKQTDRTTTSFPGPALKTAADRAKRSGVSLVMQRRADEIAMMPASFAYGRRASA